MDNPQDMVSKLLSDPENLKTIAKIASGFMGASAEPEQTAKTEKEPANAQDESGNTSARGESGQSGNTNSGSESETVGAKSVSTGAFGGGALGGLLANADFDKSIGLLGALKPYLGSHKKETCDMLIKTLGAAKLFGMYKG